MENGEDVIDHSSPKKNHHLRSLLSSVDFSELNKEIKEMGKYRDKKGKRREEETLKCFLFNGLASTLKRANIRSGISLVIMQKSCISVIFYVVGSRSRAIKSSKNISLG